MKFFSFQQHQRLLGDHLLRSSQTSPPARKFFLRPRRSTSVFASWANDGIPFSNFSLLLFSRSNAWIVAQSRPGRPASSISNCWAWTPPTDITTWHRRAAALLGIQQNLRYTWSHEGGEPHPCIHIYSVSARSCTISFIQGADTAPAPQVGFPPPSGFSPFVRHPCREFLSRTNSGKYFAPFSRSPSAVTPRGHGGWEM